MINFNREYYDADVREWAAENIDCLRGTIFLGPRQMMGRRFKDTEYVLCTLESIAKQSDFLQYPLPFIAEALKEAAKIDWWYEKEKDYYSLDDVGEIENLHENDGEEDGRG